MDRQKLNREDLKQLKEICKQGNYEAIVALLDVCIAEAADKALNAKEDHRFAQGVYHALKDFRDDIVKKKT